MYIYLIGSFMLTITGSWSGNAPLSPLIQSFRLIGLYFGRESAERLTAILKVVGLIACLAAGTACSVGSNIATGRLFNALQASNAGQFRWALAFVFAMGLTSFLVVVIQAITGLFLTLYWRRWLSNRFVERWLKANGNIADVDNPDQRIAEDVARLVEYTMELTSGLIGAMMHAVSFAVVLWNVSSTFKLSLGGHQIVFPGFLLWIAIFYAIAKTLLAWFIGRPVITLDRQRQRVEADYRFSLIRIRDDAVHAFALDDPSVPRQRFSAIVANQLTLLFFNMRYLLFSSIVGQFTEYGPYIFVAPTYFAGGISLGVFMQAVGAFKNLSSSLAWFVDTYLFIADWRASIDRLVEFDRLLTPA